MGVEGAAIGTLISRFCMLVFIAYYVFYSKYFKIYISNTKFKKLSFEIINKIVKLGLPSACQMFFEVFFYSSDMAFWFLGKMHRLQIKYH